MPLSIEELKYRLANAGRHGIHDQLVKMAREKGYRYFQLKNRDAYAIYDAETNEPISGKKLIPGKEALRLMETLVRHDQLHGDNDPG
jgi:hypothetical protein